MEAAIAFLVGAALTRWWCRGKVRRAYWQRDLWHYRWMNEREAFREWLNAGARRDARRGEEGRAQNGS